MFSGWTAGLPGGARLDVGQLVVIWDEDGNKQRENDSARSEQEGRTGNDGLLQRQKDNRFIQ